MFETIVPSGHRPVNSAPSSVRRTEAGAYVIAPIVGGNTTPAPIRAADLVDTETLAAEVRRLYGAVCHAREEVAGVAFLVARSVYQPLRDVPELAGPAHAALERVTAVTDELRQVAEQLRALQQALR